MIQNIKTKLISQKLTHRAFFIWLFYWIFESFIDSYFFGMENFFSRLISPDFNELWMRTFTLILLVGFGLYSDKIIKVVKSTEELLTEGEKKYRSLIENVNLGVYRSTSGGKGKFIEANPAMVKMFGYENKEEMLAIDVSDLFQNPLHRTDFNKKILKEGFIESEEFSMRRKDGTALVCSDSAVAVKDKDGEILYFDGIIEDISERKKTEEALHESEARYQDLYDNAPDMFASVDVETAKIINCNNTFVNATGYAKEEIIGSPIFEMYHPDSIEAAKMAFKSYAETGEVNNAKLQLKRKNGKKIDVMLNVTSVRNEKGAVLYSRSSWRDISDIRKAEEFLRESEIKYRHFSSEFESILDHLPALVFYKDKNNNFVRVNKYMADAYNLKKEELEGKNLLELHSEDDAKAYHEDDLAVLKKGKPRLHIVEPWETEKGLKWVSTSKIPFKDSNGNMIGIIGISIDITEQKEVEEELRRKEEGIRLLLDSTVEGIYGVDLNGNCTFANPACVNILGYDDTNQLIGKNMHDLIHHTRKDGTPYPVEECRIFEAFREGKAIHIDDEVFWHANGTSFLAEYRSHPIESNENIIGTVVTFIDVTERKKAENELRDFVHTVSHDLKAPLRKLSGFSDLLVSKYRERLDGESLHYLERIKYNAEHMNKLIDDLLELSQIGKDGTIEHKTELIKIIKTSVDEFGNLISEKNAKITIAKNIPKVKCDKVRLLQVFSNLIGNALKFSKEGVSPKIKIGCKEFSRYYRISVKDNGIGIEQEYFENIFGLFQRLNKSEQYEGTGIGLTIVKKIIENINGRIWVESEPGLGSTFYFTIPKK